MVMGAPDLISSSQLVREVSSRKVHRVYIGWKETNHVSFFQVFSKPHNVLKCSMTFQGGGLVVCSISQILLVTVPSVL